MIEVAALVLIITWLLGFLLFTASKLIHLLLLAGIALLAWKYTRRRKRIHAAKNVRKLDESK